jgi:FdhD protein/cysteine desulfurase
MIFQHANLYIIINITIVNIFNWWKKMDFLRQTEVIQWKDGEYRTIKENSVDDEYTYLFIDYLPPRKFSTYPKDLEDFAIGYCLGEGLIKDYSDIESIRLDGTNVLITTRLSHDPEEDLEQDGIVQERKGNCQHACVCRLLEYNGVNSDNAGGIRSDIETIDPIVSDLTIDATQIIKDIKHLTDEAKVWQKTAGVHVAQLKYKDNIIIREDVSRHVAVDKVIGAAAKEGYDFSQSYISYSGRMPADMLIKVIRVGIPIIISNAAPAASGIDVARLGNITMVGFVRDSRFTVFTAPERVNLKS